MVTFLVCLVVVGGAVVAIVGLTMGDSSKPATDAVEPRRGVRSERVASTARRAAGFLIPNDTTSGRIDGRLPPDGRGHDAVLQPAGPTLGTVALLQARTAPDPHAEATLGTVALDLVDPAADGSTVVEPGTSTLGTVALDHLQRAAPGSTTVAEPTGTTAALDLWSDAATAIVAPPAPTLGTVAVEQVVEQVQAGPGVYAPSEARTPSAPAVAAPRRPARRPRPSFVRRTLGRARGAVGLLVLLVALGTLLAMAIVALGALLVVGVRAAVGT